MEKKEKRGFKADSANCTKMSNQLEKLACINGFEQDEGEI